MRLNASLTHPPSKDKPIDTPISEQRGLKAIMSGWSHVQGLPNSLCLIVMREQLFFDSYWPFSCQSFSAALFHSPWKLIQCCWLPSQQRDWKMKWPGHWLPQCRGKMISGQSIDPKAAVPVRRVKLHCTHHSLFLALRARVKGQKKPSAGG